jgi:hypothetical protein
MGNRVSVHKAWYIYQQVRNTQDLKRRVEFIFLLSNGESQSQQLVVVLSSSLRPFMEKCTELEQKLNHFVTAWAVGAGVEHLACS